MAKCDFSIIVPCYNVQNQLERCVTSLINQEDGYGRYEIILVDDGSVDKTGLMCDEYCLEYKNIKSIHKKNGGLISAWKSGLRAAEGEYILFCDADDYVSGDLLSIVEKSCNEYKADMIIYGYVMEYDSGRCVKKSNRLRGGLYNRNRIEKEILPVFFSTGRMNSGIINNSRWTKVIKRDVLLRVADDICDEVTLGEDLITKFVVALNVKSIYCISDFYPYHYVRSRESMTGGYDADVYNKLEKRFENIEIIADKYGYIHTQQITREKISSILFYTKKLMSRSTCYIETKEVIDYFFSRQKQYFRFQDIKGFSVSEKAFAVLIFFRMYLVAYIASRLKTRVFNDF